MNKYLLLPIILLLWQPAVAIEIKSTAADQVTLSLTVYNGGRALVRDQRRISSDAQTKNIAFMDVAEKIMPQTVAIRGLDILEQNYDYDLLSPQALIDKNIGNNVRIARRSGETGETLEWREGRILSSNGGIVLQMKDGSLEALNSLSHYQLVFDQIPSNLRTSPTLSLLLKQPVNGGSDVDMTYLTTGLSWQSDYVLQLNEDETSADLDSWITLNNQSGIGYQNARLHLLAGDVNMQQVAPPPHRMKTMVMEVMADSVVSEQALHGYHLYTVPHRTTINNRQSKQIRLFSASAIEVSKQLLDRDYVNVQSIDVRKSKPEQFLSFNNNKPALGIPLPKGIMRVYAQDTEGNNQFIGEDGIDHSAVNDELKIKLGKAFDITVQRKTTKFLKSSKKQHQLTREIKINNGSKKTQQLDLVEIMPSQKWVIKQSSSPFSSQSPSEALFQVSIPALQDVTIVYDVELTYI